MILTMREQRLCELYFALVNRNFTAAEKAQAADGMAKEFGLQFVGGGAYRGADSITRDLAPDSIQAIAGLPKAVGDEDAMLNVYGVRFVPKRPAGRKVR